MQRVLERVVEFLPNLLGALVLVLLGWLLARILQLVGRRLTRYTLTRLGHTQTFETGLETKARYRTLPEVVGRLVFWIVMFFFVAAGIEALGLRAVSDLLGSITTYLPKILLATVIVFAALLVGDIGRRWASAAAARAGMAFADGLGRVVQVGLLVFAILIAIDQLGIASSVIVIALAISLGSAFGAAALAFGLGARLTVSNIMAAHYVRQNYQIGHHVRLGELEGKILEIQRTAVILESPAGRVQVPAAKFAEDVSILLTQDR